MRPWLLSIGWLAVSAPAIAQNAPTGLLGGEMAHVGANDCFIYAGYSTFQRNFNYTVGAGAKAVITFPTAFCMSVDYSGQAVMLFNSPTSGVIRFMRFPSKPQGTTGLPFTDYSETYLQGDHAIVVKFNVRGLWPVTLTLQASNP